MIPINPQLCKTLNPNKFSIPKGEYVLVEPKYDGLRCIVPVRALKRRAAEEAFSRTGGPFWNVEHILNEISGGPIYNIVLDGELFSVDWNTSMSICKRQEAHPQAENIHFHVWDIIPLKDWIKGSCKIPLTTRKQALQKFFSASAHKYVEVVNGVKCYTWDDVERAYEGFLDLGYEGAVVKYPNSEYGLGRRSPHWLKWKPYADCDLPIIGCLEGEGKRKDKIGKIRVKGEVEWNDKKYQIESEVGSFHCTDAELIRMWNLHQEGKLTGLLAEVRFDGVTVNNALRNPRFQHLREDRERVQLPVQPVPCDLSV